MNTKSHSIFTSAGILVFLGLLLSLTYLVPSPALAQTSSQTTTETGQPLQITDVTVSPEPVVGQTVTLEIEIISTADRSFSNSNTVNFTVST